VSLTYYITKRRSAGYPHSFTKDRRGFALLITITLLAFLVLLLVSLAALTRVETQVAANNQTLAQARQNALMALNIAVGQLQKYAGSDMRVTAQANSLDSAANNPWFTGVWTTETATGKNAETWLVSGNETTADQITPSTSLNREAANPEVALALDANGVATNGPASASPNRVMLVGPGSVDTTGTGLAHGGVVVPGVPVEATVPGFGSPRTIGRFAYWVGDQGVKVSLGNPDLTNAVTYAPYDTATGRKELRRRISFDASPLEIDPRDALNSNQVGKLLDLPQAVLLTQSTAVTVAPSVTLKSRFHDWAVTTAAVLSNTVKDPATSYQGLRRDLSQKPDELGNAFVKYADYTAYMEKPGTLIPGETEKEPGVGVDGSTLAVPAITAESPRRRYKITPPTTAQGWQHSVSPVLTSFIMQFNVRRQGTTAVAEVRSRFLLGMWNPYTSALVPESLLLEIEGLPTIQMTTENDLTHVVLAGPEPIDLQALYAGSASEPMRISLNNKEENPSFQGDPDDCSWLPGRLYYWRTKGGAVGDWHSEFYNRTISAANADLWVMPTTVPYTSSSSANVKIGLSGPASTITIKLKRASDGALLATYTSPQFSAFSVPLQRASSNNEYRITFPFRLAESLDTVLTDPNLWLTTAGHDPRRSELGLAVYLPFGSGGVDPAASSYVGSIAISAPDRLFDRVMGTTGMSFNEDVPLFELPRRPILSLAELQHVTLVDGRPFTVGNPWGDTGNYNKLFDRYFFSGLTAGSTPDVASGQPLPNTRLAVIRTKPDGSTVALADLQAAATDGLSAKYLLQTASFNINSTSVSAWRAVLRGMRFTSSEPFEYVKPTTTRGGATDDTASGTLEADQAVFSRFPQSAQETYQASPATSGSGTYAASTTEPPAAPNSPSYANTQLFRNGLRVLTSAELDVMSTAIVDGVREHNKDSGPFRSLDEFLDPIAGTFFTNRSVIQRAIDETKLNDNIAEFSSQFLTQADVVTAMAPRLFARSDTFMIRTYGEVVNPATGEATGKAWCEALVQRMPAPVGAADIQAPTDAEYRQPTSDFGRGFKIISFRWLSRADI
jgi:hypothetical protein